MTGSISVNQRGGFPAIFFDHFRIFALAYPDVHPLNGSTYPLDFCSFATTTSGGFEQRWVLPELRILDPCDPWACPVSISPTLVFFFRLGYLPMLSSESMLHCYVEFLVIHHTAQSWIRCDFRLIWSRGSPPPSSLLPPTFNDGL